MKISNRSFIPALAALFLFAVLTLGCASPEVAVDTPASACVAVTEIEGVYECGGECVVTKDGSRQLVPVHGETDTIERFPEATEELYRVSISGNSDFHEVEIGALSGLVLRTATAEVSDGQFPVLEEYVFEVGPTCEAMGFTKIVRNPNPEYFKSCAIRCERAAGGGA